MKQLVAWKIDTLKDQQQTSRIILLFLLSIEIPTSPGIFPPYIQLIITKKIIRTLLLGFLSLQNCCFSASLWSPPPSECHDLKANRQNVDGVVKTRPHLPITIDVLGCNTFRLILIRPPLFLPSFIPAKLNKFTKTCFPIPLPNLFFCPIYLSDFFKFSLRYRHTQKLEPILQIKKALPKESRGSSRRPKALLLVLQSHLLI